MAGVSVLERVTRLPLEYRDRKISMRELLEEIGYLANPGGVTFDALEDTFAAHPELIDAWVRESEDSRSSSYPWIKQPDSENAYWTVGPSALAPQELWETFHSGAEACAAYVTQYLHLVAR
jgi:hypothetical protein